MKPYRSAFFSFLAILAALTGCSGIGMPSMGPTSSMTSSAVPLNLTAKNFTQFAKWGPVGAVTRAECPSGDKVVAGGSSSSDGSFIGAGWADDKGVAWVVSPRPTAKGEAFAACVSIKDVGSLFTLVSARPINNLASATCGSGYSLITGYGRGTVHKSWFDPGQKTFFVRGGGVAYASCVKDNTGVMIKHAWNRSQFPKNVFAGCGGGNTVIAGSMGNNEWPGPPVQSHPGVGSNPATHGYAGWWTFSHEANELTWAACVKT